MKRILSIILVLASLLSVNSCSKTEPLEKVSLNIIGTWVSGPQSDPSVTPYQILKFVDESHFVMTTNRDGVSEDTNYTYSIVKEDGYIWIDYHEEVPGCLKYKYCIWKFENDQMYWINHPLWGSALYIYSRVK